MTKDARPQINVSKIKFGGGIAGAIFTIGSMAIFLTGLPMLRYFLLTAAAVGCGIALAMHFTRRETPGKPWISSPPQK